MSWDIYPVNINKVNLRKNRIFSVKSVKTYRESSIISTSET